MPTSITPPSAWPSSRDCSRPTATVSASSRSPIGAIRRPSPRSANRAWASSSRPATWTRWSTTSRSRRSAAARTRIRPAARPACVPITPASSTETSSAARTRRRPSSSAASRRACVAWRTTITGGLPQALHPARLGRRPHLLRHGRAFHHRDCGRPGQRPLRP